ncbi:MAG: uncharacterized protein V7603_11 [Micromonosporaceae bacterium]
MPPDSPAWSPMASRERSRSRPLAEASTAEGGADLAEVVARFGALLRDAGLPVGPDRCERFARAVTLARPATNAQLRWCARATLAGDPGQAELLDRVFDAVFGGVEDIAERGDPNAPALPPAAPRPPAGERGPAAPSRPGRAGSGLPTARGGRDRADRSVEVPSAASAQDRLSTRDFAGCSPEELLDLARAMSQLRLATPPRRSRRTRPVGYGRRVDLRTTLRRAHRTGGDPLRLAKRLARDKPRRLVVLCDISGSMEPYARAMLQLLYCAAGGTRAEVFTFATQLTRLTRVLSHARPTAALARAGRTAPDWSGGTRIGAALKDFTDRYGRRGMARGAIVLIISDGWETGDAALLGREMARLSLLAYRIVWANPRTASARYRPLVGGMAAALPHCDAVVSAHSLAAVPDLVAALADPVRTRTGRAHRQGHRRKGR